jgi:transposase
VERLEQASREELIGMVSSLLARVGELEAEVEGLREEVRRLRRGGGSQGELSMKPSRPVRERKPRKGRDRAYVRRREVPDEVRYHAAERCPDCGHKLEGGCEHRRRQTIEVLLQLRVVDHVMLARWCGVCGKRVLPELESSELGVQGKRRFGASVQGLVGALHIAYRVSMRMIRRMLREMVGLQISEGEVVELLDGAKRAGRASLQQLLEAVRGSPAVCADETGWRQDGCNGYLWGFFTPTLRWFEYRDTRAGQVPQEVLGEEFGGTVTCDFYSGYNRLGVLQRCWVHLLRDAKELAQINPDRPEVAAWVEALAALYQQAKAFLHPNERVRQKQRRHFERLAVQLARPYVSDPEAPQCPLAQRIMKHKHELFVFVSNPQVPGDNNLAERSLRPAVIARKISGGTRSAKGSQTKMGLMSLVGTWTAQGKPLLESFRQLLSPTPP